MLSDDDLIKLGAKELQDGITLYDAIPHGLDAGRLYRVLMDRGVEGLPSSSAPPTIETIKQVGQAARDYLARAE